MASIAHDGESASLSKHAPSRGSDSGPSQELLRNVWVRRRVTILLITATALGVLLFFKGHQLHNIRNLSDPWTVGGLSLIGLGLLFRSWAASILDKGRVLAKEGPYSSCRHPLYVGSFLMLMGFFLLIDDPWTIVLLLTVIFATYPPTIAYEEARMADTFGSEWTEYSAGVGRLPRMPRNLGPVSARIWLQNAEYKAVLASAIGLLGIELWRIVLGH